MNDSGFRQGYRLIFSFPSSKRLLVTMVLTLCVWFIFSEYFLRDLFSFNLPLISLTFLLVFTLQILDREVFNLKRILGLLSFLTIYLLLYDWLSPLGVSAITPILLLLSLITYVVYSPKIGLVYMTTAFLFSSFPEIIYTFLYSLAMLYILHRVNTRVYNAVKTGGLDFLRTFLHYILAGRKERFEKYLLRISKKRSIPIYIIALREKECWEKIKGAIVISYIHPGPFRDIGSSTLPASIIRTLGKHGYSAIYFKGPCGHGEDLALSSATDEVAQNLVKILSSSEGRKLVLHCIKKSENNVARSILLHFGDYYLAFISPKDTYEDLPLEIHSELGRSYYSRPIVVDTHNSIFLGENAPRPLPGTQTYYEILTTVLKSIRECEYDNPSHLEYTPSAAIYNMGVQKCPEIGPGGLTTLVLTLPGLKLAILSYDSNNIQKGFREYISAKIKQLGFDEVIVTSTDTHVYSGFRPRVEYQPLGSSSNWSLLEELTIDAVSNALKEVKPVTFNLYEYHVCSYFLDEEKLNRLSSVTEKNVRDGIVLFLLLILHFALSILTHNIFSYSFPPFIYKLLELFNIPLR